MCHDTGYSGRECVHLGTVMNPISGMPSTLVRPASVPLLMRLFLLGCGVWLGIRPQILQAQFRTYSNEFLNIGAGARGLAMGNAQIASVDDASAGYWNPAGLAQVKDQPVIGLMHADYFAGIAKYDYAAVAIPVSDRKRTLGVSILRFAIDDIPNTLFLVEPDGSLNYNNIRTFSSADYAFLFSYAQEMKKLGSFTFRVGGNAKIIYRKVGSFANAWGFGVDAGVQLYNDRWRLGAVLRDATTTFNAWRFSFTDREKEVLYLTKNDIPVRSTEMTAPRLLIGAARQFRLNPSISLLAEANAELTFDGKRNTLLRSRVVNLDPRPYRLEAGPLRISTRSMVALSGAFI